MRRGRVPLPSPPPVRTGAAHISQTGFRSHVIARAFMSSGLTSAAVLILGIVTGIIAARVLGPEDRGHFGTVVFWVQFLAGLSAVSLADAAVMRAGQTGAPAAAMAQAARGAVRVFLISVLPGAAVAAAIAAPQGPAIAVLALLLWAVQLADSCAGQAALGATRIAQRFAAVNAMRLATPALYAFALAAVAPFAPSVGGFLVALAAALCGSFALRVVFLGGWPRAAPAADDAPLMPLALHLHATTALGMIAAQLDKLFVIQTAAPAAVGVYLVAATLAAPVQTFLAVALKSIALPALLAAAPAQRPAAAVRLLRLIWAVSLGGAGAMALAAPWLAPALFGSAFAEAGPLASALTLALALLPVRQAMVEILKAEGDARTPALGEILFAGVFAVSALAATAAGAAWPAVWALAAAHVAATALLARAIARRMPAARPRAWAVPRLSTARELALLARHAVRSAS